MKTYEQLNESLTKGVEWKWITKNEKVWTAAAHISSHSLKVQFFTRTDGHYLLFEVDGNLGKTKTGHAFTIFATVKEIVQSFVKQNPSANLRFLAAKSDISRNKLYDRLSKEIALKTGSSYIRKVNREDVSYIFDRTQ